MFVIVVIYIGSVWEGLLKCVEYFYLDYIFEFECDIYLFGMEEEIEWWESDVLKYVVVMYMVVFKVVN